MTRKEAIEAIKCNWPDSRYTILREALDMAIEALRQQENECVECSGIVYRQTNSGKIIPLGQRCGAKITPPCYVPDGDGCSYQIYGDNNDEPIDRCKSCPLCQSDKVRHKQEHFRDLTKKVEPLTMDDLRKMDGEPVYCVEITGREEWLFRRDGGFADMYGEFTSDDFMVFDNYGKLWWCYRQKPEEGTV